MYFYYLMAAMGPRYQKYLWWKRHLTALQMIQFLCVGLHGMMPFFADCGFPKIYCWYCVFQSIMFFQLFNNFRSKTYRLQDINVNNNKMN
jgi:elongation of very long chain fatty acids protein 7